MVKYIKCPRCDLNYIDSEKQEYCDVCLAEMKGRKLQFADLDEEDYENLDNELEAEELCPICGVNPIHSGEKCCEQCRAQQAYEEEDDVDMDKDEDWKNYLEESDEDLTVDESLKEEIEEDFADDEDEDEFYDGDDDDPLADLDEDFDDDDYDDDEDDDDEDDDDDF